MPTGTPGADIPFLTNGGDTYHGLGGNDRIDGRLGNDFLYGDEGNDTLMGNGGVDYMNGGTGWDVIDYSYSTGGWLIDIQLDQARSLSGPTVETIRNFEYVNGSQGSDRIYGDTLANEIAGRNGNDYFNGRDGDDLILGGSGVDRLVGGRGFDRLYGEAGDDVLYGGPGGDILVGGLGSDRFVFTVTGDSPGGSPGDDVFVIDIIRGFNGAGETIVLPGAPPGSNPQDIIDVSAIDANTGLRGKQTFTFLGDLPLGAVVTQAGTLWVSNSGNSNNTILYGNTDGDAAPEFVVRIEDNLTPASAYSGNDFDI